MVFQALIARQSTDARLAVALTRLNVASRGRQRTHQVALAISATGLDISISILKHFEKFEYFIHFFFAPIF
jgi:hypothetical protein